MMKGSLSPHSTGSLQHDGVMPGGDHPPSTLRILWWRLSLFLSTSRFILSLRNPSGRKRRIWNFFIVLFTLYNAFFVPLTASFRDLWDDNRTVSFIWAFEYLGDTFFLFDIVLNFFTPFTRDGIFRADPSSIVHHYLTTWFVLDVASVIPFDFLSFTVWKHALLRLNRLLRLFKLQMYFRIWEQRIIAWNAMLRFGKLFIFLLIVIHWFCCIYIASSYWKGFDGEWFPPSEVRDFPFPSLYLFGLFWATNILMGVGGEAPRPESDYERAIALFVAVTSIFIVAIIIGSVTDLIQEASHKEEELRRKVDHLNCFMTTRRLPEELQNRIRHYFLHVVHDRGESDDFSILDELPVSLKREAVLFMNHDIIRKVPLFQEASESFTNSLVELLQSHIYVKGDVIVKKGEIGEEMYFLRSGQVGVYDGEGRRISSIGEGGFFGEIALLHDQCIRTATIVCLSGCDMFVLSRRDLDKVCSRFPEERSKISLVADRRTAQDLLRETLHNDSMLRDLSREALQLLEQSFVTEVVSPDTEVFHQYQTADVLYFIGKGSVVLSKEKDTAKESNSTQQQQPPKSISNVSLADTVRDAMEKLKPQEPLPSQPSSTLNESERETEREREKERDRRQSERGGDSDDSEETDDGYPPSIPKKTPEIRQRKAPSPSPSLSESQVDGQGSGATRPSLPRSLSSTSDGSAASGRSSSLSQTVAVLHAGSFFGGVSHTLYTLSATTGSSRHATQTGMKLTGPSILLELSSEAYSRLLSEYPSDAPVIEEWVKGHSTYAAVARSKLLHLLARRKTPWIYSPDVVKSLHNHPLTAHHQINISHPWMKRLGDLNKDHKLDSQLDRLSLVELQMMTEIVFLLNNEVTKEIFCRASSSG